VAVALRARDPRATVALAHDDGKSLRIQIQTYLDADVFVLGHGAGMVHALWLRPGAQVIEIIPRTKAQSANTNTNGAVNGCARVARAMGLRYRRVEVKGSVAEVSVDAVADAVKRR
jgi:hypothetical protein